MHFRLPSFDLFFHLAQLYWETGIIFFSKDIDRYKINFRKSDEKKEYKYKNKY